MNWIIKSNSEGLILPNDLPLNNNKNFHIVNIDGYILSRHHIYSNYKDYSQK